MVKRKRIVKGFDYYRTKEQLLDYMRVPARDKLRWLEEMRELNNQVAKQNPQIGLIQDKFRNGTL